MASSLHRAPPVRGGDRIGDRIGDRLPRGTPFSRLEEAIKRQEAERPPMASDSHRSEVRRKSFQARHLGQASRPDVVSPLRMHAVHAAAPGGRNTKGHWTAEPHHQPHPSGKSQHPMPMRSKSQAVATAGSISSSRRLSTPTGRRRSRPGSAPAAPGCPAPAEARSGSSDAGQASRSGTDSGRSSSTGGGQSESIARRIEAAMAWVSPELADADTEGGSATRSACAPPPAPSLSPIGSGGLAKSKPAGSGYVQSRPRTREPIGRHRERDLVAARGQRMTPPSSTRLNAPPRSTMSQRSLPNGSTMSQRSVPGAPSKHMAAPANQSQPVAGGEHAAGSATADPRRDLHQLTSPARSATVAAAGAGELGFTSESLGCAKHSATELTAGPQRSSLTLFDRHSSASSTCMAATQSGRDARESLSIRKRDDALSVSASSAFISSSVRRKQGPLRERRSAQSSLSTLRVSLTPPVSLSLFQCR